MCGLIRAVSFSVGLALPCLSAIAPPATQSALIDAIKDHNGKRVAALLTARPNVNIALPDGATPLAWAVYLDEPDMVDLLMHAGAKVNTVDQYGETPLTIASSTGDAAIIEKLIAAGADAKSTRWDGETALMLAARAGSVAGVKMLIEHGAQLNAVEERKGQNALMWAAAEGHGAVVDLLIQRGADIHMISKGGFTPLVFAVQKGDAASVDSLLTAGLTPNYTLPNGTAVLSVAVAGGKPELVKALLDHKAAVDTADSAGSTPLHQAAQLGNVEIVKLLLEGGANPNAVTAKTPPPTGRSGANLFRSVVGQQTALLLAAKANHEDVMRVLVAGGADPKLKAQDGLTLLMAAAGSGHLATVKYAFELDPALDAVTTRKSTVMHAAVSGTLQVSTQAEICAVISFLASKGADVDPEDVNGRTPIVIANFAPIDEAVTLMTKLIEASGKKPKKSPSR